MGAAAMGGVRSCLESEGVFVKQRRKMRIHVGGSFLANSILASAKTTSFVVPRGASDFISSIQAPQCKQQYQNKMESHGGDWGSASLAL